VHDPPDGLHLQPQAFGTRGSLGFERFAELHQHHVFETREIVACDRFTSRNRDLASIRDRQHAPPHGAEPLPIVGVMPTYDRHPQGRQEVGMAVENAEAATFNARRRHLPHR
jgi:hypothetical protein